MCGDYFPKKCEISIRWISTLVLKITIIEHGKTITIIDVLWLVICERTYSITYHYRPHLQIWFKVNSEYLKLTWVKVRRHKLLHTFWYMLREVHSVMYFNNLTAYLLCSLSDIISKKTSHIQSHIIIRLSLVFLCVAVFINFLHCK